MHRRNRFYIVVTLLSTVLLAILGAALAAPASAGGPTSVLLVVPGEGRTASLYTGSADYDNLTRLVDAYGTSTGDAEPPPGAGVEGPNQTSDASGSGVTLTWLVHDAQVWRIDRIYPNARGGVLISTQSTLDFGGDIWAVKPVWNRAGDGPALTDLLNRLGVGPSGGPARPADPAAIADQITDPVGQSATEAGTVDEPATSDDGSGVARLFTSGIGLAGLGVGLLVGLALGVAVGVAARRRHRSEPADGVKDATVDDAAEGVEVLVGPGDRRPGT